MKKWDFIKKIKRRFYQGPDWVEIPDYLLSSRYKSPTVIMLAWFYAYYTRLITIPGQLVLLTGMTIIFYSFILTQNIVLNLSFILMAVFFSDIVFGFIFRPKFIIRRDIPQRVRAGSIFKVDFTIKNKRKIPAWNIVLDSYRPRSGLALRTELASAEYLAPGRTLNLSAYMSGVKRGRHFFPSPIAESLFPFSIFKWSCRSFQPQNIIIYPKYEPLLSIDLPSGRKYQKQDISMISKIGESMDFLGCREFRDGDNPRHIHWLSSAKTGKLIVREFQEECISRIALIVDTYMPPENFYSKMFGGGARKKYAERLESAISLSASIADYSVRKDCIVDLFAAGPTVYHLKSGRSLAQLDVILDILACIEPNSSENLKELSTAILNEISDIGTALVVLVKWDESRNEFIKQFLNNGVTVKAVLICEDLKNKNKIPEDVIILSPSDISSGNVKNL